MEHQLSIFHETFELALGLRESPVQFQKKIGLEYIADDGVRSDVVPALFRHSRPHSIILGPVSQETT